MAQDFAAKLRLTAAMLGCATRKDLCARFRAANPATSFDLERAHKWLQGRALPRNPGVYADWVKVLGTGRSEAWLVSCSREAFLAELCQLTSAEPAALQARAAAFGGAPEAPVAHYLCGDFVVYSCAWTARHRDRLIRGRFRLSPGHASRFAAEYHETIAGGPLVALGTAEFVGRVLHAAVRDPSSDAPLFFSVLVPGRPGGMLCGVLSGATLASDDPEPSASRVVLLRAEMPAERLDAGNRYLSPGDLATDLAALGLAVDAAALAHLLAGGPMQVGAAHLAALSNAPLQPDG